MFDLAIRSKFRQFSKRPVNTGISVLSLSLGIVCTVFTALYVQDELSYDSAWEKSGSIYRIESTNSVIRTGEDIITETAPAPVASLLRSTYVPVEYASRLTILEFMVSYEDIKFYETIHLADPDFLNIFDLNFINGFAETALSEPNTIVITESVAQRYFSSNDVIGRQLLLDNDKAFRVSAVIEDLSDNTHLNLDMLTNLEEYESDRSDRRLEQWYHQLTTYLFIDELSLTSAMTEDLDQFLKDREPPDDVVTRTYSLTEIGSLRAAATNFGVVQIVPSVVLIGIFILALACINYINITMSHTSERNKELAVHKVLGAQRLRLAFNVIVESMLQAFVALIISVMVMALILPLFNELTGKEITLGFMADSYVVLFLIALTFVIGCLSGLYPACVLSFSKVVALLKNESAVSKRSLVDFKKLLIIFQYTVAVSLSTITLFVYFQLDFMQKMDLGFDREDTVIIDNFNFSAIKPRYEEFRLSLLSDPSIVSVTRSQGVPGNEYERFLPDTALAGAAPGDGINLNMMMTGYEFFETYGIELIGGRYHTRSIVSDEVKFTRSREKAIHGAVINESAARALGWSSPEQALGEVLAHGIFQWRFNFRIIGVVKDFDIMAGHSQIKPYIYILNPSVTSFVSVKVARGNVDEATNVIDDTWQSIYPDFPIERTFLDEELNRTYESLNAIQNVIKTLTIISIIIAIIGSFGLAAAAIRKRTKEISIRKILGSDTFGIMRLVFWDFGKLVIVSNIISGVIAFFVVSRFLEGFQSRIQLDPAVFVLVFISSVAVITATVCAHSLRVINTNPAETLRKE